jgi:hypothetical protein
MAVQMWLNSRGSCSGRASCELDSELLSCSGTNEVHPERFGELIRVHRMACYEGGQSLGGASPRNGTADVVHPLSNTNLARSKPLLHLVSGDQLATVAELLRSLVYRHIEFVVLGGVELLQGGESFTNLLL